VVRQVLGSETGPVRDAVLINAAAAIASYRGMDGSILDAVAARLREAAHAVDSDAARTTLDRWITAASDTGTQGPLPAHRCASGGGHQAGEGLRETSGHRPEAARTAAHRQSRSPVSSQSRAQDRDRRISGLDRAHSRFQRHGRARSQPPRRLRDQLPAREPRTEHAEVPDQVRAVVRGVHNTGMASPPARPGQARHSRPGCLAR
jgi:hypothetical protein